ncbi:MAG TPA: bifunctional hydroxymethylpyrimidine kinase/phosphomethylpyrimidine kinase [bacterium]
MIAAAAPRRRTTPTLVVCAGGSDPMGCAGLAADLHAVKALGGHPLPVITAVTVQDTRRVLAVEPVAPRLVRAQLEAVLADGGAQAVKVGMLATAPVVRAVAGAIERHRVPNVVVDPVLHATTGGALLDAPGIQALLGRLFPLAAVLTPNIPEAEALLGAELRDLDDMVGAARALLARGPRAVLLKGGHRRGGAVDVFVDARRSLLLRGPRVPTRNTRGTGCLLAAAIAVHLGRGLPPLEAAHRAKAFVLEAIRRSYPLGRGRGPANAGEAAARAAGPVG